MLSEGQSRVLCHVSVYVIDQYSVILIDCNATNDLKQMSEFTTCLAQKYVTFKKQLKSTLCFINWNFEHAEKYLEALLKK